MKVSFGPFSLIRARPSRDAFPSQNVVQQFATGCDRRAGEQQARALELELTELIVADPIRVRRTPNVMGYSFARRIDRVGAEIGSVTVECRSNFRVCAASGIVGGEERTVIPHDMRGHVAPGVIKQLAEHLFS